MQFNANKMDKIWMKWTNGRELFNRGMRLCWLQWNFQIMAISIPFECHTFDRSISFSDRHIKMKWTLFMATTFDETQPKTVVIAFYAFVWQMKIVCWKCVHESLWTLCATNCGICRFDFFVIHHHKNWSKPWATFVSQSLARVRRSFAYFGVFICSASFEMIIVESFDI